MQQDEKKVGIQIPMNKLSEAALNALVEEFILREGTDYGTAQHTLEDKKRHIFKQLQSNKIIIMFDPKLENTTLITQEGLTKLNQQNFEIVNLP